MEKMYSTFWLEYCNGAVTLSPEFAQRDHAYIEESETSVSNIHGKVNTRYGKKQVSGANTAICDIEGNQV